MAFVEDLLPRVKQHLILDHDEDDDLLRDMIAAALGYAKGYQHLSEQTPLTPTTEHAVIMLSSHFYESRDGSTAGFFADNPAASQQVWHTVNSLLRLDRNWSV